MGRFQSSSIIWALCILLGGWIRSVSPSLPCSPDDRFRARKILLVGEASISNGVFEHVLHSVPRPSLRKQSTDIRRMKGLGPKLTRAGGFSKLALSSEAACGLCTACFALTRSPRGDRSRTGLTTAEADDHSRSRHGNVTTPAKAMC
jgi:hypothetical protein